MVNKRQLLLRTVNEEIFRMVDYKALEPRLRQSKFPLLPYTLCLLVVVPMSSGTQGMLNTGTIDQVFTVWPCTLVSRCNSDQCLSSYLATCQQVNSKFAYWCLMSYFRVWVFFFLLPIAIYQSSEVTWSAMGRSPICTFSEFLSEIVGNGGRTRVPLIRFQVLVWTYFNSFCCWKLLPLWAT